MKIHKILYIIVFLLITQNVFSKSKLIENTLNGAISYYDEKKYDSALILFNLIIDSGYFSSSLYYNLGNTYYKLGKYTNAIYFYEKCLKLNPTEQDAKINLNLANEHILDKFKTIPQIFYKRWWNNFIYMFTMDLWAVFSVLMIFISCISFFLFKFLNKIYIRKTFFYTAIFSFLLFIIFYSIARSIKTKDVYNSYAIIFSPTVNVQSEPSKSSTTLYVIHEGVKIQIIESKNKWKKIKLPNGNIGWINQNELKII